MNDLLQYLDIVEMVTQHKENQKQGHRQWRGRRGHLSPELDSMKIKKSLLYTSSIGTEFHLLYDSCPTVNFDNLNFDALK